MLKLNCLLANTALVKAVENLMEIYASDMIADKGKAPFKTIYASLIKDGVDIDIESAAALYEGKFDLTQDHYTSLDKLYEESGKHFEKALGAINDAVDRDVTQKVGPRSAGKVVADRIAKMFSGTLAETHKIKTQMRVMSEALEKAVRTKLESKGVTTTKKSLQELLDAAVETSEQGFDTLTGGFNSMDDLVNEFKTEMAKYTDGIEDPDTKAQWETYTDKVVNSMYSAFLSTNEADTIIREALFAKGFGKEVTKPDGTKHTVIDWNKLSANVKSDAAMEHNVKSAIDGLVTPEHADKIYEALKDRVQVLRDKQTTHQAKELDRRNAFKTHTAPTELGSLMRLHNLGAFNTGHGTKYYKLLSRAIGAKVEDVAALNDILKVVETANYLFNTFGDFPEVQQRMNEAVSKLINRYRTSKTPLLKAASGFRFWMDSVNQSILMSLANAYIQNPLGNQVAIWNKRLAQKLTGDKPIDHKEVVKRANAIFKDASTGGGPYGASSNWFISRHALDSYLLDRDIVKNNEGLQKAVAMALGTYNLSGLDSRSKYILTEMEFQYNVKKFLMDGGMSEEDAQKALSEALYGQSFDDAKVLAEQIIDESNGVFPKNKNSITRLADSIVHLNLIGDGLLTKDQFKALYDASYESAGLEIGHETDEFNFIGRPLRGLSHSFSEVEKQQLKDGKYNSAALTILLDTIVNKILFKFVGGSSNWMITSLKRSGLGALTALRGDRKVDFSKITDQDLKQAAKDHHLYRYDMSTGIIGGLATLATFLALAGTGAGGDFREWLSKNKWAKKYAYAVLPMVAAIMVEAKDKKLTNYLLKTFYMDNKYDFKSNMVNAIQGKGQNGYPISKEEASAAKYKAVGDQVVQFPVGIWRTARDAKDAYLAALYGTEKEYQENPTHALEALLWGGILYETGAIDYLKSEGMWPETVGSLSGIGDKTEDLLEPYLKGMNDGEKLMYLKNQIELQIAEHDWNEAHPHTPYQGKKTELKKESETGNMVNIFNTDDAKNALNDINDVKEVVEKEIKKEAKKKVQRVEIPVKYN